MKIAPLALLVLVLPATAVARLDGTEPGPHAVGVTTLTFTKPSETTGEPRRLHTLIWYPAVPGTGTPEAGALRDATMLRRRWPLVMFSHGSCAFPAQSPFFTAGLASWGFVVAAPPHPGNTISDFLHCMDGDVLADSFANRVADIRFVIDQLLAPGSPFANVLNPRRIGMSGHSFGGQTTLRVAAADTRIRAAVAMAPAVLGIQVRIAVPTMIVSGELDTLTPFDTSARTAFSFLEGPRFLIKLLNTGHCAFAVGCVPGACGAGCEPRNISTAEAHQLVLRYSVPFLLRYVAGKSRFGKLLRPNMAPPGAQVLEAHPRG
jgi:predicted dienelactone hydrolase